MVYAEHFISATFATVIYRMQPLLMLMFIPFLLRERITKTQVAALLLGFVGIYIALSGGNLFAFSGANTSIVLVLLAVTIIGAMASVFLKRYMTNMESTMFMFNSVSLVFATALFLYSGARLPTFNLNSIMALLYMGIPTSVFVTYFYFRAFRTLKTTFVTNFYLLSPFITAIFAAVFLNETIQSYYLAIAVLVAAGIIIQRFDKKGGTYLAKKSGKLRDFAIFDVSGAFANTGDVVISSALRSGDRVMAVKLPTRHRKTVEKRVSESGYKNVFTNEHTSISNEVGFIKDIMRASPKDMILIKVGSFDEGEAFFGDMSDLIGRDSAFGPVSE